MHDEPEKKRKGLRLVSRKSTRKIMGKWRKLSSDENDGGGTTDENNFERDSEERENEMEVRKQRMVLGLRLEEAVAVDPSMDGVALPAFFRLALDFIEENGLSTEGIYRLSPPKSRLDELERRANSGEQMVFADAHDAAGLIKRFLRQLPDTVLPSNFEQIAESCSCGIATTSQLKSKLVCKCGAVKNMRNALENLEIERRTLFIYVFLHAQHVMTLEKENKMGLQALGLLLQTILEMSRKLVCFCAHTIRPFDGVVVEGSDYLIDSGVKIRKYVPPMPAGRIEKWLEDGENGLKIQMVAEELEKQQFLLEYLHLKISARHEKRLQTSKLDEEAWQVQNCITAIKRRMKQFGEITPIVSVDYVDTRCFEIYEEKQLMATQGMLKEDVEEERRRIARLCWKVENLGAVRKEEAEVEETSEEEKKKAEEWKEKCKLEEAARSALLAELTRLRLACSGLRAKIEFEATRQ